MTNLISFIVGPWLMILILKFAIEQFKKLGAFFKIVNSNDKIKHSKNVMILSLVKYLITLFVLVLCTYRIFIFPLIPIWILTLCLSWNYIKLWKYQEYSVLLFISVFFAVITVSVLISPIFREFLGMMIKSNWGGTILTLLAAALTAYNIFSKQDDKEAVERNKGIITVDDRLRIRKANLNNKKNKK